MLFININNTDILYRPVYLSGHHFIVQEVQRGSENKVYTSMYLVSTLVHQYETSI